MFFAKTFGEAISIYILISVALLSNNGGNKEGRLAAKMSGITYYGICSDSWTDELSRQACINMGFRLVQVSSL